ncbi:MAG: phytoene/squalene synthase family protein [Planctomycetota bacterium]
MSDPLTILNSYEASAKIARRSGSSFYRSFWLLPKPKRQAMSVLYAFARVTDDLGDCDEPAALRRHWLDLWRQTTAMNLIGKGSRPIQMADAIRDAETPALSMLQRHTLAIMPALRHAAERFEIPSRYLLEIIDGVLADQQKNRFDTFEQLEHYCYLVASAVGIACLHIWEFESPLPKQAAVDCGLAFQLTNILRDVREDAQRGRIYLPRQHYEQHGLDEDDLLNPRRDARMRCLIQDETRRATELFDAGWQVHDSLHPDGRPMFSMMWRTYRRLLQRIADDPDVVMRRRVSLGLGERMSIVMRHFIPPLYRRLPIPPREITRPIDKTNHG